MNLVKNFNYSYLVISNKTGFKTSTPHQSVLKTEAIESLAIKPAGVYIDATTGFGGHSNSILSQLSPEGKLFCFEQDAVLAAKLRHSLTSKNSNYEIINANFRYLETELAKRDVFKIDGILFDLGVSSYHFDTPERGFSYRLSGPLDMRLNQNQKFSAVDVVNTYSQEQLINIFWKYGDVPFAKIVARAIVQARAVAPITTSQELVKIIKSSLPMKILNKKKHPARQVFQALRIEVNDELGALQTALNSAVRLLNNHGRIVAISFHSLEDRMVKTFFKKITTDPHKEVFRKLPISRVWVSDYRVLTKKPIVPTFEEIKNNYRSRSAHMRVLEKAV